MINFSTCAKTLTFALSLTSASIAMATPVISSDFSISDELNFRSVTHDGIAPASQGLFEDFQAPLGSRGSEGVFLDSAGVDDYIRWDHDIRDDGYDQNLHTIDSATLHITFKDDELCVFMLGCNPDPAREQAMVDMLGISGAKVFFEVDTGTYNFKLLPLALTGLADGVLDFVSVALDDIGPLPSDFYVQGASLDVNYSFKVGGIDNPNSVPEPGSLALMALGLLGLGSSRGVKQVIKAAFA